MKTSTPLMIDGIDHPVLIRPHPRAKRFTMRFDDNGVIKVTTPRRFSKRKVIHFIKDHQKWIDEQYVATAASVDFQHKSPFPLQGQEVEIIHTEGLGVTIKHEAGYLYATCPKERLAGAIKRYLKNLARETITPLAHEKALQSGKTINRIAIKDTKTRWGSCSGKKNLNFSWRIILAPPSVLDYLVAHEVAHLTHMNHSQDFWDLCMDLALDGERGKKWLKKNGRNLHRY